MNKTFIVAKGRVVSSRHYKRDFKEGEVLDLTDKISDEEAEALLASGAVLDAPKDKQSDKQADGKKE